MQNSQVKTSTPLFASPHPQATITIHLTISALAFSIADDGEENPKASAASFFFNVLAEIGTLSRGANQARQLAMMSDEDLSVRGVNRDDAVRFAFKERFQFDGPFG